MKKLLNKKGFTLIELIVVIAILAILALILIPSLSGYIAKATSAKDDANARAAYSAAMLVGATWDTDLAKDGPFTAAKVATKVINENPSFKSTLTVNVDTDLTKQRVLSVVYNLVTYPKP